jgi:hypothetical protein
MAHNVGHSAHPTFLSRPFGTAARSSARPGVSCLCSANSIALSSHLLTVLPPPSPGPVCANHTKGPVPFGDQARSSPSQNKASKTPQSPRRTLADVSNTWQVAAGASPAQSGRRGSLSASSGALQGPEAVGRIRGGCSLVSDGVFDSGEEDHRMETASSDACKDMFLDEEERDCASSMGEQRESCKGEPWRLRGGGPEPDSDPYALETTASEVFEAIARERAAEMEGITSSRVAERQRADGDLGAKRKHESIYTRPSPFESENPYEAYKNLPPGARFDKPALKSTLGSQQQKPPTRGAPAIRKPGQKISTVKNLFKTGAEKREEEQMLFSPRRQKPKTEEEVGSAEPLVVDLEQDEDAELARALAESEREFAAQGGGEEAGPPAAGKVSKEQDELDRAIALSLQEAAGEDWSCLWHLWFSFCSTFKELKLVRDSAAKGQLEGKRATGRDDGERMTLWISWVCLLVYD